MSVKHNTLLGRTFEFIFFKQARRSGLYPIKNDLSGKHLPGGRIILKKSDLDFRVFDKTGRVAYVDCKSYQKDFFIFSALEQHQLKRAVLYNRLNVPSGFVVFFRQINSICFFSGRSIAAKGPNTSFRESDGVKLGTFESFDLSRIFAPTSKDATQLFG